MRAGQPDTTAAGLLRLGRGHQRHVQAVPLPQSDLPVAADLETLVRLVATGRLHPEIGSVESWDNTAAVIEALSARRIRGKAVLTITP